MAAGLFVADEVIFPSLLALLHDQMHAARLVDTSAQQDISNKVTNDELAYSRHRQQTAVC